MTTILGLGLGKFKSVACLDDPDTQKARDRTITTDPDPLRRHRPDLVVFETGTIAGWVADLCGELGLPCRVADPNNDGGVALGEAGGTEIKTPRQGHPAGPVWYGLDRRSALPPCASPRG